MRIKHFILSLSLFQSASSSTGLSVVIEWTASSGILSDQLEWVGKLLTIRSDVGTLSDLLNAQFSFFRHDTGFTAVRTLEYSLPAHLHNSIRSIQPVMHFAAPTEVKTYPAGNHVERRSWHEFSAPFELDSLAADAELNVTDCEHAMTPDCIKELYRFGRSNLTISVNNGNKLAIAGFLNQSAKYDELQLEMSFYAPYALGSNFTWSSINGGLLPQNDNATDTEGNFDLQYGHILSYPIPTIYLSTGGVGPLVPDLDAPVANNGAFSNEPYLEFLQHLLQLPTSDLPQTISISYSDTEQSVPESYAHTVCDMFGLLGLRGVSVLVSSGDYGPGSGCETNDGTNRTRFTPTFPPSCPWVTSVGATWFVEPEQAANFSSGGFSDRFARPAYQKLAVSKYLDQLGTKWQGLFNASGRGFPDVAAQGYRNVVVYNDTRHYFAGTSASAPIFASVISILNSKLISAGRPPLGFLNPWLYSIGAHALNDITNGSSTGCTGTTLHTGLAGKYVEGAGWAAVQGWDPVTGLGTPDLQSLENLLGL
ncbi:peptidase S8/S53 domain-containing protein [Xylariales sp. PMI_506]|nr:peptidase S8/S53 domain-containing protein [Xylariales sp. PMI_506]